MADAPIAVITGTTHGIGTVTSRELARAGYPSSCCVEMLRPRTPWRRTSCRQRPAARSRSCTAIWPTWPACAPRPATVRERFPRIDRLINNAGMVSTRHRRSVDGQELTFATNHLGPFLLTRLLLPALGPVARIINVASKVHYRGRLDLDSVDDPRARYSSRRRLFALEARQCAWIPSRWPASLPAAASRVNCLHPGWWRPTSCPRWLNLHPSAVQTAYPERRTGRAHHAVPGADDRGRGSTARRISG